jgi:hypothetical protein
MPPLSDAASASHGGWLAWGRWTSGLSDLQGAEHWRGDRHIQPAAEDLVVFEQGLSCTWDVHTPVRKHYRFG